MVKTTKDTGNTENKETTQAPKTDAQTALEMMVSALRGISETNKELVAKIDALTTTRTPSAKKTKKVELTPEAQQEKENKQTEREIEYARLKVENQKAGRGMLNARYYCDSCKFHTYNGPDSLKDGMPNNPWVKHLLKNAGHKMLVV